MFCTRRERAAGRSLVRLLVQLEKFFSRQRPKLWNAYREAPRNSFFIFILVEPFNFGLFYARVGFTKLFECSIVLAQAARRYRPIIFHWHLPRAVRCREQFPDGAASEHVRQNCSMGLLGRSCPSPRCKETTDIQLRLLQRLTEDALVGWDCFSQLAAGFGPSRPLYPLLKRISAVATLRSAGATHLLPTRLLVYKLLPSIQVFATYTMLRQYDAA